MQAHCVDGCLLEPAMTATTHRLCVAPMMDWTDRHCRYFLRLITRHARLYTEMITTRRARCTATCRAISTSIRPSIRSRCSWAAAIRRCSRTCAKLGERWGYDEINLNCGCPSERVQTGSFGACLMAEPALVADCVRAMRDAVAVPVTVKHRIGLDHNEDYGFVRDFVGTVATAGCDVFIVHARNAVLKGLSPKENREVPPLRYDVVHRLKREFPALTIVANGGLATWDAIERELAHVDGVMLGRVAYHDPWLLAQADWRAFGDEAPRRFARRRAARADAVRRRRSFARGVAAARDRVPRAGPLSRPVRAGGASARSCPTAARLQATPVPSCSSKRWRRWSRWRPLIASAARGDVAPQGSGARRGMSSAMYARTMLVEIGVGLHPEREAELRREVRRPGRHDAVDRRIELPLARDRRRRRRRRAAAPPPCRRPRSRCPAR